MLSLTNARRGGIPDRMTKTAALIYTALAAVLVAFQIALSFGAPWGELAMGGRWPGQFPVPLRLAALAQAALISVFAWVVLTRAGLIGARRFGRWVIWVVFAFSALAVLANLTTPSANERLLWAPVALVMMVCCLRVALSPRLDD